MTLKSEQHAFDFLFSQVAGSTELRVMKMWFLTRDHSGQKQELELFKGQMTGGNINKDHYYKWHDYMLSVPKIDHHAYGNGRIMIETSPGSFGAHGLHGDNEAQIIIHFIKEPDFSGDSSNVRRRIQIRESKVLEIQYKIYETKNKKTKNALVNRKAFLIDEINAYQEILRVFLIKRADLKRLAFLVDKIK